MSDDTGRLGFVEPLLTDPEIEEIIVLGGERTFVVRGGRKELVPDVVAPTDVRRIADQLLVGTGRRVDLASPIVSAQLPDGSRVHITGPPVTKRDRLNIQIRKFVLAAAGLSDLVATDAMSRFAARLLAAAITTDRTVIVAGAPGAGKTTLVNCLLREVPPERRVVTCEEVFEIDCDLPDITQMQTRDAGLDGAGAITLRDLVREALRQRPDRIVVGEVRGPEALDMTMALNAGCSGLATVHANSARDALDKIVGYCALAGQNISIPFIRSTVAAVTDLVVFVKRDGGHRRIDEIVAVARQLDADTFTTQPLFKWQDGSLEWLGMRPPEPHRYEAAGVEWPV
jgi:pilus assembly protein CpaF